MTEEVQKSKTESVVDIHGKPYRRGLMVLLVLLATFAGVLMQTVLGTTIPTLMRDYNISMATAQQATTWFLLANGIMIPVSAYLATKFSTKRLYMVAYLALFLGMVIVYAAPAPKPSTWWVFLVGRILQASAVGISMPLMQVVFVNIYPPEKMGMVMGMAGLVVGLAPAIGPTFAGWILDKNHIIFGLTLSNSWRTIFLLPMLVLGLCLLASPFVLRDVLPNRDIHLDVLSLIESVLGFGLFLWGFTNVATDGWGKFDTVILPIILGVVIIALFSRRQFKLEKSFLDLRVFKIKQFTLTTIVIALITMAMMGVEMMLPLYMQEVHGLSALNSGLILLPGALMMGIMSPIAGIAYDKVGAKRLAMVGAVILMIGTFPFIYLSAETPNLFITVLYSMRMFGIAMVFMPLTASAMHALPVEEAADGTAANNTARQVASAVVVALLSSVTQNVITNAEPAKALKVSNPLHYADKLIQAMLTGYHVSFALGFVFAILAFLVALFLQGHRPQHDVMKGDA
ncbi:MDR family MFS transporter [Lactococcus sp.]|uniref:MDR family MFS transporter n=1 Tax=Lactococcus sp. TaxID=44273 RepID=UPI0035B1C489